MNSKHLLAITGLALSLGAGSALAQDHIDLDDTIRTAGDAQAELPAAVTEDITLPSDVAVDPKAVEASEFGLKTASDARKRRNDSRDMADASRDDAADYADAALGVTESASRGDSFVPEETPEVPDVPGGG